jgi:hypothetical protein
MNGSIYLPSVVLAVVLALAMVGLIIFELLTSDFTILFFTVGFVAFLYALQWVIWRLTVAFLLGNSIRVGQEQYPQIHQLIQQTSEILKIEPPTVLILQGKGLFEAFVARRFSRRGLLMITSNLTIAIGYFRLWTIKHTIGKFALLFYLAWKRRCQMTADRLGLLIAGDLLAAEQALIIITSGSGVAPGTKLDAAHRLIR